MTTAKARQPKGTRTGGQFAETSHKEATVQLSEEEKRQQERERPLTVQDVEYLLKYHGTYDPGEGYYERMPKVFEAAAEKAANTDDGRLVLRQRAQAAKLAEYTGIPPREILSFFDEVKDLEPMSSDWENTVQMYSQHVWNRPRGEVIHIEAMMRGVTGKPEREELVKQRDALTAQIDALDVAEAAAGVRRRFPTALRVIAEETYNPEGNKIDVLDAEGKSLWAGRAEEFPEMYGRFDLIPANYHHERSPLRTSVEPQDEVWIRTYNLDRMAAVTAEDLA